MTRTAFQIAGGTILGRDHLGRGRVLVGRSNQDGFGWRCTPLATLAVVCDGCGSAAEAEVGGRLGPRLILEALARHLDPGVALRPSALRWYLERVRLDALERLQAIVDGVGGEPAALIRETLLFTVLAAIVTPRYAAVFAIGDGTFCINGHFTRLGPFPENAPPYLASALLDAGGPAFRIHRVIPTARLHTLLIGTDGVVDLIAAADATVPGTQERLGALEQFWTSDRYFENADAIRRRLARANRECAQVDHSTGRMTVESGLLPDDTTIVVLRRSSARRAAS